LNAKTALIVPFSWTDNDDILNVEEKDVSEWLDALLARQIVDKISGQKIALWEIKEDLPDEVGELVPQLRQLTGWTPQEHRYHDFVDKTDEEDVIVGLKSEREKEVGNVNEKETEEEGKRRSRTDVNGKNREKKIEEDCGDVGEYK